MRTTANAPMREAMPALTVEADEVVAPVAAAAEDPVVVLLAAADPVPVTPEREAEAAVVGTAATDCRGRSVYDRD
jgi:hypothetical protein